MLEVIKKRRTVRKFEDNQVRLQKVLLSLTKVHVEVRVTITNCTLESTRYPSAI